MEIREPGRYCVRFVAFLLALYLAEMMLVPDTVLAAIIDATGRLSAMLATALGIPSSYAAPYITTTGVPLRIDLECTALHFHGILTAAIVTFPGRDASCKLLGVVAGNAIIVMMNLVRIVILGVVAARIPDAFSFVHLYLWQGVFVITVFAIWWTWLEKAGDIRRNLPELVAGVIAMSLLAGFFDVAGPAYLQALALPAGFVLKLLSGVTTTVDGMAVTYLHPSGSSHAVQAGFDAMALVLFLGLAAGTAVTTRRHGAVSKAAIRASFWIAVIHAAVIVAAGMMPVDDARSGLGNVLWIERGIMMVLPVLFWLDMRKVARPSGRG